MGNDVGGNENTKDCRVKSTKVQLKFHHLNFGWGPFSWFHVLFSPPPTPTPTPPPVMSGNPGKQRTVGYISALGIPIAGMMGGLGFQKGSVASKSKPDASKTRR